MLHLRCVACSVLQMRPVWGPVMVRQLVCRVPNKRGDIESGHIVSRMPSPLVPCPPVSVLPSSCMWITKPFTLKPISPSTSRVTAGFWEAGDVGVCCSDKLSVTTVIPGLQVKAVFAVEVRAGL